MLNFVILCFSPTIHTCFPQFPYLLLSMCESFVLSAVTYVNTSFDFQSLEKQTFVFRSAHSIVLAMFCTRFVFCFLSEFSSKISNYGA